MLPMPPNCGEIEVSLFGPVFPASKPAVDAMPVAQLRRQIAPRVSRAHQVEHRLQKLSLALLWLPSTEWMLEVGALFLRTETELILKSRRVIPGLLSQEGFAFMFPRWSDAARDSVARWREMG
jgi:hypothetical protein